MAGGAWASPRMTTFALAAVVHDHGDTPKRGAGFPGAGFIKFSDCLTCWDKSCITRDPLTKGFPLSIEIFSSRHRAARGLAQRGVPVFPCRVGAKEPATPHGYKDETTDLTQIDAWWDEQDYNIGVRPWGLPGGGVAIDCDTYKEGGVSQPILDMLGETRTHQSPRGGFQKFFIAGEQYSNAGLAVNVDVRGANGYVLWPPSVVNGVEYKVIDGRAMAPLPQQVADALRIRSADTEICLVPDDGIDHMLDEARAWCARYAENQSSDRFVAAAALVRNFGLTNATATALATEFGLRMHSDSPEGTSWEKTLDNARTHGLGVLGEGVAFQEPQADDTVPPEVDRWAAEHSAKRKGRFGGRLPSVGAAMPPITYWDTHKTLPKGPGVGMVVGESGNHKTGVLIKSGLDIIEAGGRVLYIAAEGAYGIETARLPIAREVRAMAWDKLDAGWRTESEGFNLLSHEDHESLISAYSDFAPDIVILDVLTKVAAGDINTPAVAGAIMNAANQLAWRFGAPVVGAHHPGKDTSRGALGSVLLTALADFVWQVAKDQEGRVWVTVAKMKDGPAEFSVPYRINFDHGAPVIGECGPVEIKPIDPAAQQIREFLDLPGGNSFDLAGLVARLRVNGIIPEGVSRGDLWVKRFLPDLNGYVEVRGTGRNTVYEFNPRQP